MVAWWNCSVLFPSGWLELLARLIAKDQESALLVMISPFKVFLTYPLKARVLGVHRKDGPRNSGRSFKVLDFYLGLVGVKAMSNHVGDDWVNVFFITLNHNSYFSV